MPIGLLFAHEIEARNDEFLAQGSEILRIEMADDDQKTALAFRCGQVFVIRLDLADHHRGDPVLGLHYARARLVFAGLEHRGLAEKMGEGGRPQIVGGGVRQHLAKAEGEQILAVLVDEEGGVEIVSIAVESWKLLLANSALGVL